MLKRISFGFLCVAVAALTIGLRGGGPTAAALPSVSSQSDCGPASLYLVCKAAGVPVSFASLKRQARQTGAGTSLLDLKEAATQAGWRVTANRVPLRALLAQLQDQQTFAILYLGAQQHFVAVLGRGPTGVVVADPRSGAQEWTEQDLEREGWQGHVLFLAP